MSEYQAGECNIGEAEQRRRYALGGVASVATLVLITWVLATDGPMWVLGFSVIPLFGAAEGFFQGRFEFCPLFASLGIYDVSTEGDDRREVPSEADRRADARQAWRIHAYSAALAVVLTLILYVVAYLAHID
ncbi:hypothetical protein [Halopelagius longus]|uniref:DUF2892 domain-containing protein n=1 Tax=Halopelagius longus TaxID=1236180 RepID=A0A1H1BX23_9EURY|nr:hypothetical protein [Halopelagius longus]RDI70963.1 hypothetical protein DWB78_04045 [Halopelagius longus]SDQ56463.1 hypothetical protein SAMN05216278_1999 [Halopelagius longus]